jgi:bla regulator protein BlaR1
MNILAAIFSAELTEALGWMLIHSLWQGAIIAILLFLVLYFIRKKSAQIKYFLSFVALVGIMVWAGITFFNAYQYASEKQELKTQLLNNPDYLKNILSMDNAHSNTKSNQHASVINPNTIKFRAFFQRNFNIICLIWFVGMSFMMVRFTGGLIYTHRLRTQKLSPISNEWEEIVKNLVHKLGIKRKVEVFFSPLTRVPVTLGAIKPVVLFPISALTGLTPKEFEAVIAHELAHIMRNDYLFNILQSMIEMLFFYHPAIWIISAQVRAERENSCDNIAVDATGNKIEYIKTLAAMQIKQTEHAQFAMAFSAKRGSVLQRIKRLQKEKTMKTNFIEGLIAAGIIAGGLMLASFTSNNPTHSLVQVNDSITQQNTNQNRDSLMNVAVKNTGKLQPEQQETIEKAIEIAMSETNSQFSSQMMQEINKSINGINLNGIINVAMQEAAKAMKEASKEIEKEGINEEMKEAAREIQEARKEMEVEMRREMEADGVDPAIIESSVNAAKAGMDVASFVVGNLNVEGIVSTALGGASAGFSAFGNIEVDSPGSNTTYNSNDNSRTKQLEKENEELKKKQVELEKRLKELEDANKKRKK